MKLLQKNGEKSIWDSPFLRSKTEKDRVTLPEMLFGYFLGPFLVLAMTSVVSSYYLTFYRSYDDIVSQGMFLTLLPLLSVIPMAISNMFVGILVGKTKTRAGKARPYLLASAPILMMAGILVFCIPELGLGMRMVWMAVTFNLFAAIANPIYSTSHYLMVSLSTRDLNQRGRLSVIANIPAVAGNGLVSSILLPMILSWINAAESHSMAQNRWKLIMTCFSLAACIGCILEYMFTRERITEEDVDAGVDMENVDEIPTKVQLKAVAHDKFWWIVMIFYLFYQMGVMFKGGYIFNIFCHDFLNSVTIFGMNLTGDLVQSVLALISGIPLALGMLFIWPLANHFGKKNMIVIGCAISIVGSIVCLSNPSDFVTVLIGQTLKGISSIPGAYVMMALFADVLDHLEAVNGFRVDGVSMSVYNLIMTVVNGLAVAVFNFFYDQSGLGTKAVSSFFFLGFEIIAHGILIILMSFLTVEKNIVEEQKCIAERKQKK